MLLIAWERQAPSFSRKTNGREGKEQRTSLEHKNKLTRWTETVNFIQGSDCQALIIKLDQLFNKIKMQTKEQILHN